MSGLSRSSVPRNAPVANSNTRNSYDGALSAKPGVPGSGGRPVPGGAQSNKVGSRRGWMQVHPAAVSWAGVTPSAEAGLAVESVAPPASAAATVAAAIRALTLIRGLFMTAFPSLMLLPPQGRQADDPGLAIFGAGRAGAGPHHLNRGAAPRGPSSVFSCVFRCWLWLRRVLACCRTREDDTVGAGNSGSARRSESSSGCVRGLVEEAAGGRVRG